MSQPVTRITTNPEPWTNAAGEGTKKPLVIGRLLCLSATNIQASPLASTGENCAA